VSLAIWADIQAELDRAEARFPAFNSAHEGFAIILEEIDELKAHVWMKQGMRLTHEMRREAVQAAAMLVRFISDICDSDRGNR
jgi:hypothetical protein